MTKNIELSARQLRAIQEEALGHEYFGVYHYIADMLGISHVANVWQVLQFELANMEPGTKFTVRFMLNQNEEWNAMSDEERGIFHRQFWEVVKAHPRFCIRYHSLDDKASTVFIKLEEQ